MRDIIYIAIGAIGLGIAVKTLKDENFLVGTVVAAALWVLVIAPVIRDLRDGSSSTSSCAIGACQNGGGGGGGGAGSGAEPREGAAVGDEGTNVARLKPVEHWYTPLHPVVVP